MYTNYLITESNELTVASRNATKMKYLLKENRELKGQILDYQSVVTLNKEALKVGLGLTPINQTPTTQNSDQVPPQQCKFFNH